MPRRGSLVAVILTIALAPLPAHSQTTLGGEWRDDVKRIAQSLVEAQPGGGPARALQYRGETFERIKD